MDKVTAICFAIFLGVPLLGFVICGIASTVLVSLKYGWCGGIGASMAMLFFSIGIGGMLSALWRGKDIDA